MTPKHWNLKHKKKNLTRSRAPVKEDGARWLQRSKRLNWLRVTKPHFINRMSVLILFLDIFHTRGLCSPVGSSVGMLKRVASFCWNYCNFSKTQVWLELSDNLTRCAHDLHFRWWKPSQQDKSRTLFIAIIYLFGGVLFVLFLWVSKKHNEGAFIGITFFSV